MKLSYNTSPHLLLLFSFGILFIYPIAILTKLKIYYIYSTFIFYVLAIISFYIKRNLFYLTKKNGLVILFFSCFYLSSFWGIDIVNSLLSSFWITIYLLIYIIFCAAVVNTDAEKIGKVFLYLPIFFFFINIYVMIKYGDLRPLDIAIHKEIGSYSNHMVGIVEICIPFIYYYKKKSNYKLIANVAFLITIFNILISQSRGGVLILATSIILTVLFYSRNISSFINILVYLLLSVVIILAIMMNINFTKKKVIMLYERIINSNYKNVEIFNEEVLYIRDKNINVRTIQYQMGINTIRKYPIGGIGYGNFKHQMEKIYGIGVIPHNFIFTIWTGSGLLGLLLFFVIIVKVFRNLWKQYFIYKKINPKYSFWYISTGIAFSLLLLHGLFRPLLNNPILYLVLALGLMSCNFKKVV